jgi:Macrocin-O-methyltransferase (TylF)
MTDPYERLSPGIVERERLADALAALYNSATVERVETKEQLYDIARARIGADPIVYLEFGVKNGKSMSRMAERFTHPHSRFYGFDSFEGLPEDWQHLDAGFFSREGRIPKSRDMRVKFVKGWFQNSLPEFLKTAELESDEPMLVHLDADLYSSTLFVLAQLWERRRAYYVIFDEFFQDEAVALYDFWRAFPVEIQFYAQTTTSPFKQVFGRIERVEFKPKR